MTYKTPLLRIELSEDAFNCLQTKHEICKRTDVDVVASSVRGKNYFFQQLFWFYVYMCGIYSVWEIPDL